jgi:hypothetical protein
MLLRILFVVFLSVAGSASAQYSTIPASKVTTQPWWLYSNVRTGTNSLDSFLWWIDQHWGELGGGEDGADGADGQDGAPGTNGVGVVSATVGLVDNEAPEGWEYELILRLTDGTDIADNFISPRGPPGEQGIPGVGTAGNDGAPGSSIVTATVTPGEVVPGVGQPYSIMFTRDDEVDVGPVEFTSPVGPAGPVTNLLGLLEMPSAYGPPRSVLSVNLASNAAEFVDFGAYAITNYAFVVTSNGSAAATNALGLYFAEREAVGGEGVFRSYTSSNGAYWLSFSGSYWYFLTSWNGGGVAFVGTAPGTEAGGPAGNYKVPGLGGADALTVTATGYSGPGVIWRFPDPAASNRYLSLAGGTVTGSVYSTVDHVEMAPADNELITAKFARSLAMSGAEWYFTQGSTNGFGEKTTNFVALAAEPPAQEFSNVTSAVTSGMYIAGGVTTNLYTMLRGPITIDAYLARVGGNLSSVLPVHGEIYYEFNGMTNHLGDWSVANQLVTSTEPTRFQFVVAFPETAVTGAVRVVGYLKAGTVSGTSAGIAIYGGGIYPSHMDIKSVEAPAAIPQVRISAEDFAALTVTNANTIYYIPE